MLRYFPPGNAKICFWIVKRCADTSEWREGEQNKTRTEHYERIWCFWRRTRPYRVVKLMHRAYVVRTNLSLNPLNIVSKTVVFRAINRKSRIRKTIVGLVVFHSKRFFFLPITIKRVAVVGSNENGPSSLHSRSLGPENSRMLRTWEIPGGPQ